MKKKIFCNLSWLVGLSLAFMASSFSLSAEAFAAPSGYYGVVIRANGGAGFSKILREASPSVLSGMDPVSGSYEGITGTANVHFGLGMGSYIVHIGASYLNLLNIPSITRGLDIVEVTDGVESATHNIELLSWLFGCTFYHVRSALYITTELRFLQNARRTTSQVAEDITYEEITNYRSVIGAGVTVGIDWWLSSFFAIGIGLVFYYDLLNIVSNEISTIEGDVVMPVGDTIRNDATNISYIFAGLVINLLIN